MDRLQVVIRELSPTSLPFVLRPNSHLALYAVFAIRELMKHGQLVTMKYLADVAGVNPGLVRKYVAILRSLVGDYDLFSAQEGSLE